MASNAYQWPFERSTTHKVVDVHEVDSITTLAAKVELLPKTIDIILISNSQPSPLFITCDICAMPYPTHKCRGEGSSRGQEEQVSYVGNTVLIQVPTTQAKETIQISLGETQNLSSF